MDQKDDIESARAHLAADLARTPPGGAMSRVGPRLSLSTDCGGCVYYMETTSPRGPLCGCAHPDVPRRAGCDHVSIGDGAGVSTPPWCPALKAATEAFFLAGASR